MNKATKQILEQTLRKNPRQMEDVSVDLWRTRDITSTELRTYRKKYYKIIAKQRRREKIREFFNSLFHLKAKG